MLELSELHFVRAWNSFQGIRKLTEDKPDALSQFVFFRATEDLKLLSKAIKDHVVGVTTDEWQALLAAVDFFGDCDNPCFSTPEHETKFNLQCQAFMTGFGAGKAQ